MYEACFGFDCGFCVVCWAFLEGWLEVVWFLVHGGLWGAWVSCEHFSEDKNSNEWKILKNSSHKSWLVDHIRLGVWLLLCSVEKISRTSSLVQPLLDRISLECLNHLLTVCLMNLDRLKLKKIKAPSRRWAHHYCKYAHVHSFKPNSLYMLLYFKKPN